MSDKLRTSWNREWESEPYNREPTGITQLEKRIAGLLLEGVSEGRVKVVLSIGCGPCTYEKMIANDVGAIVGVDISDAALQMAKRNVPENVQIILVGGTDLQFVRDSQFDLVICLSTFQHLPARIVRDYFQECFRVLKPGGMMKCNLVERKQLLKEGLLDLSRLRLRLAAGRILQGLLLWGQNQLLYLPSWPVGKPWSRQELRDTVEAIGFQRVEFKRIGSEIPDVMFLTLLKSVEPPPSAVGMPSERKGFHSV